MTEFNKNIKEILTNFHGIFSSSRRSSFEVDEVLNDMYLKVYGDINMSQINEDKENLHNDSVMLKKSFKKSVRKYKEEVVNG